MAREIDVHIENLPHDIVYMETKITDGITRKNNFTNPSDAKHEFEKRQARSALGVLISALFTVGLGLYGTVDISSGIHNGNTEQIKSGVFEVAMCGSTGIVAYRSLQENSIAGQQISKLKDYFPEKQE